jgi:hypothetical protein
LCFFPPLYACPPHPLHALKQPPSDAKIQPRWFRTEFYSLYLVEQEKKDDQDRLRLFVRRFPSLALLTYRANAAHLAQQQQRQKNYGSLEHYFLLMNLFIEKTLPNEQAAFAQIRQEIARNIQPPSSPTPNP